MIFHSYFIYLIVFALLTVIGIFYSRVGFAFLLLDMIDRSQILKNVIRSITLNSQQLIMTALLGIIIMYIYGIIAMRANSIHETLSL